MKNLDFQPAFTETEIKEIEKSCQHNIEQFCINQRVALSILGFGSKELCKRIASDPGTYKHLLHALKECMESLKSQIEILETAQAQARPVVAVEEQLELTV